MNAPGLVPIENIGLYEDLLDKDFIKEIQDRNKLIADNREASLACVAKLKSDSKEIDNILHDISHNIEQSNRSFDKLSGAAAGNHEACKMAAAAFRKLSTNMEKQAKILKKFSK